jgi:transcriptional regulator with XRE-family HTH domain
MTKRVAGEEAAVAIDWQQASAELVRELRGARTQKALSRALGYRSNVVFSWESGRDVPAVTVLLELLAKVGRDPRSWLLDFGRGDVPEVLSDASHMAAYASSLNRGRSLNDLAQALGRSRYVVSRWLSGKTEIPLPEFFRLVDTTTLSALDLLALLVSPSALPAIAPHYKRLEAARRSAQEKPWSHAIVHMVELPSYRALLVHEVGWFASRLNIDQDEEAQCLDLLVQMGRLTFDGTRYQSTGSLAVDTRPDPEATRRLAAFWMHEGAERVLMSGSGRFAFNAFGISKKDLEKLGELQRRYFAELRAIVADSPRTEAVAVATFQLFHLAREA